MNDEAARQGRPDTNPTTCADDNSAIGERGVFDLRLHVAGRRQDRGLGAGH